MTRLYLYAAMGIAILAALGGLYLKGRHDGHASAESEYSASVAKANAEATRKDAARQAERDRVDRDHIRELRDLQARIDALMQSQPDRVVCLSKPARSGVPANPNTAAIPDGAPTGDRPGVRAGADTNGRDVTAGLLQFAKRCEQDRLARIQDQDYTAHIAKIP
jgi:hypothetical protein